MQEETKSLERASILPSWGLEGTTNDQVAGQGGGLLNRISHKFVVAALVLGTILLWTCNIVIPKLLWDSNLRDSDTALWFCGGVLLTEVTLFGWIAAWQFGAPQWRVLLGAFLAIAFAIAGFAGVLWMGPMSRADAMGYLLLVLGAMFFFALSDCVILKLLRLGIAGKAQKNSNVKLGKFQFGMLFLLGLATWMACVMGLVSYALRCDDIAYRPYREYSDSGTYFLLLLVFYFWSLHWSLLWATLHRRTIRGIVGTVLIVLIGTEGIRRYYPIHLKTPTSYIEWEFPLVVMGFITAHILMGCVMRWRGWELKIC